MAGKPSVKKREKERARLEHQQEKAERKVQRKKDNAIAAEQEALGFVLGPDGEPLFGPDGEPLRPRPEAAEPTDAPPPGEPAAP